MEQQYSGDCNNCGNTTEATTLQQFINKIGCTQLIVTQQKKTHKTIQQMVQRTTMTTYTVCSSFLCIFLLFQILACPTIFNLAHSFVFFGSNSCNREGLAQSLGVGSPFLVVYAACCGPPLGGYSKRVAPEHSAVFFSRVGTVSC